MKTIAIIQARVRSSRLPGKVLSTIKGRPMLWHVVNRVQKARLLDGCVVATSDNAADDVIAEFCRQNDIDCTRGSESDVLDRYWKATCEHGMDTIVRITADCPLIDPAVIDAVISEYYETQVDYASNIDPPTFPDGLDTEVFSNRAIEHAASKARLESEREHVTPYLRNHPELFRASNVLHTCDLSDLRWTVDTLEDLAFIRAVFHALDGANFGMKEVCRLLVKSPQLRLINARYERNEGYLHSVARDRSAMQYQAA